MDANTGLRYQATTRDLREVLERIQDYSQRKGRADLAMVCNEALSRTATDTGALGHLLAGYQAMIKQKDEALANSLDAVQQEYDNDWRHGVPTRAAQLEGMRELLEKHKEALALTSPTDALDKIRAEVAAQALEEAAKVCKDFADKQWQQGEAATDDKAEGMADGAEHCAKLIGQLAASKRQGG
jgi:hypothetical protein